MKGIARTFGLAAALLSARLFAQTDSVLVKTSDTSTPVNRMVTTTSTGVGALATVRVEQSRFQLSTNAILNIGTYDAAADSAGDFRYSGGTLLYYDGAAWQTLTTMAGTGTTSVLLGPSAVQAYTGANSLIFLNESGGSAPNLLQLQTGGSNMFTVSNAGNATVAGVLTVNGNTALGDATTDTIAFTARASSSLLPSAANASDLGSTTNEWRTLYVGTSILWGTSQQNSLQVDQGGSIELGGTNTVANPGVGGIPYIDFHYGTGAAQDYNVRIINDANGQLTLSGTTIRMSGNLSVTGTSELAYGIQKGSPSGLAGDLGLYSAGAGNWVRYVTNAAPHKWYTDNNYGTTPKMELTSAGALLVGNPPGTITQDVTIVQEDFTAGTGAWTVFNNCGTFPTWTNIGGYVRASDPGTTGNSRLDSPVYAVPAGYSNIRLRLRHLLNTENAFDGGNVFISVNGGPWTFVAVGNWSTGTYANNQSNDGT